MSKRILVIDDDDHIRLLAAMSLSRVGGYDVSEAASGASGVAMAETTSPDAILLDVMMPGTDGPSALALLRAQEATRHVPVVFLTARVRPSDQERLLALGAAGVIGKPFDPMALPAQVAEVLGWTGPA